MVALIRGESKLQGTFDELRGRNDEDLKHFFNY
jgi:hypothetical protein